MVLIVECACFGIALDAAAIWTLGLSSKVKVGAFVGSGAAVRVARDL